MQVATAAKVAEAICVSRKRVATRNGSILGAVTSSHPHHRALARLVRLLGLPDEAVLELHRRGVRALSKGRFALASDATHVARIPAIGTSGRVVADYPELAREWHPTKNGAHTPDQTLRGSNHQIWWRCQKVPEHEWQARVAARIRLSSGCPFCSGRRLSKTNSVGAMPALALLWHRTRNRSRPEDVRANQSLVAWWKCPAADDHEWQAKLSRVAEGGCPFCRNQRASAERNLAVDAPAIAAEWHPSKNGELEPSDVTTRHSNPVWWLCSRRHAYATAVSVRVRRGNGCPQCWKIDRPQVLRAERARRRLASPRSSA